MFIYGYIQARQILQIYTKHLNLKSRDHGLYRTYRHKPWQFHVYLAYILYHDCVFVCSYALPQLGVKLPMDCWINMSSNMHFSDKFDWIKGCHVITCSIPIVKDQCLKCFILHVWGLPVCVRYRLVWRLSPHDSRCVCGVFSLSLVVVDSTHIHQGYFTSTRFQCQGGNLEACWQKNETDALRTMIKSQQNQVQQNSVYILWDARYFAIYLERFYQHRLT